MKKIFTLIGLLFSIELFATQIPYEFIDCKSIDINYDDYIKERRLCAIVVSQDISRDNLKDILVKTVEGKSGENINIDEITVRD